MIEGYDIRYSELEDLSFLEEWFSNPIVAEDFQFGFEEQADALKNWIGFSRYKASLTGMVDGAPCAIGTLFLMPYKKVAHHCSFQLFVHPDYRKRGIGTSMVRNLLNLAKTRFKLESVHVELYPPSKLLSIVRALDFKEFAEQSDFVKIEGVSRPRIVLEHYF